MDMQQSGDATIEASIDIVSRDMVVLWAWSPELPSETVRVELSLNGLHIGQFAADQFRPDLLEHGKGDGRHGLQIDLKPFTSDLGPDTGVELLLTAIHPARSLIGMRRVVETELDLSVIAKDKLGAMGDFFKATVTGLTQLMRRQPAQVREPAPTPAFEGLLERAAFSTLGSDPASSTGPMISKYADFCRYRFKVDRMFQVETGKIEMSSYMKWYLESYCAMRRDNRAPLSGPEIAHLNELIVIAGQKHHLSRATYIFMFDNPGLLGGLNLNSDESYLGIVYWWAIERSRSMFVEDCLVPVSYKNMLSGVRENWQKRPYPLSRFMEIYFSRHTAWHFLDLAATPDRAMMYVVFMLMARTNPSLMEYLPRSWLYKLTRLDSEHTSPFLRICDMVFGATGGVFQDYSYDQIARACGFDFYNLKSLALSRSRGRVASAALPRPVVHKDPAHVQIIGPMRLASGLGQASRLSANAMATTGYSLSSCAFDMDNPAPVGFASNILVSEIVTPAINLIHLNAESIPLAYAFLPDVFTGAYNIGYFFWELDSPAKCHFLALDLLDEIWVSSQYGVDIYTPHTSKPVINVGMSFEDVPSVSRADARSFVEQRVGVESDEFVFLTAFDSFSFVQRKNPLGVVRAFKAAFDKGERVRLILKTHNKDFVNDPAQMRVWQSLREEFESDPRITLVNETLLYEDLIKLKRGCDAYVSLHRSEGWGFGMVEAMNLGVPVVVTGYSGNMEFCNADTCYLVDYELQALDKDDYIFVVPGQRWAEPALASACEQMRSVYFDPALRERKAANAMAYVRERFSSEVIGQRYAARLDAIMQLRAPGAAPPATEPGKPGRGARPRVKHRRSTTWLVHTPFESCRPVPTLS